MLFHWNSKRVNGTLLLILSVIALGLAYWNEGPWLVATPMSDRISLAIGVAAVYLATLGWFLASFSSTPSKASGKLALQARVDARVIYATETGFAKELSQQTVSRLRKSFPNLEMLPIDAVSIDSLANASTVFFIASTAGEGEPPGHAVDFSLEVMGRPQPLTSLRYALLALGDSSYDEYCAFGRQLDQWLQSSGASRMFKTIDVDDGDDKAVNQWFSEVAKIHA